MSEKTVFMDTEEMMDRQGAAELLRKIADQVAQGTISGQEGECPIGENLKVEVEGKLKNKDMGQKGKIEIEISWKA